MHMKLTVSRSKHSETYYIQKSYRTNSGKGFTKTVEHLGSLKELQARFGEEDTLAKAKEYVRELSAAEKESHKDVLSKLSPCLLLKKDEQRFFNGGYLFLQKVYYELGLDKICRTVCKSHKNEYNLNEILSRCSTLGCSIPVPSYHP